MSRFKIYLPMTVLVLFTFLVARATVGRSNELFNTMNGVEALGLSLGVAFFMIALGKDRQRSDVIIIIVILSVIGTLFMTVMYLVSQSLTFFELCFYIGSYVLLGLWQRRVVNVALAKAARQSAQDLREHEPQLV